MTHHIERLIGIYHHIEKLTPDASSLQSIDVRSTFQTMHIERMPRSINFQHKHPHVKDIVLANQQVHQACSTRRQTTSTYLFADESLTMGSLVASNNACEHRTWALVRTRKILVNDHALIKSESPALPDHLSSLRREEQIRAFCYDPGGWFSVSLDHFTPVRCIHLIRDGCGAQSRLPSCHGGMTYGRWSATSWNKCVSIHA